MSRGAVLGGEPGVSRGAVLGGQRRGSIGGFGCHYNGTREARLPANYSNKGQ